MIEPPREVIGFHGTSRDAVDRVLARDIRRSDQQFEWLGTGFYLWQDSPWQPATGQNSTIGTNRRSSLCASTSMAVLI